ncbi:hypothetical protein L083_0643 [Actinoplanes sp. N902-109]|nr:hypothetical protein L083_0643 [Actinoplanes sp. N902-109]
MLRRRSVRPVSHGGEELRQLAGCEHAHVTVVGPAPGELRETTDDRSVSGEDRSHSRGHQAGGTFGQTGTAFLPVDPLDDRYRSGWERAQPGRDRPNHRRL